MLYHWVANGTYYEPLWRTNKFMGNLTHWRPMKSKIDAYYGNDRESVNFHKIRIAKQIKLISHVPEYFAIIVLYLLGKFK